MSDHTYYKADVLSLKSLKDTLVSYLERKDLDAPPDVEELFPVEICLSQYVEAWKFIVAFKQERGQRQWRPDWKGCFCLSSLFNIIKFLRWRLQSRSIDSIEAVWMCDKFCILHIFMQRWCAFLRALMFIVPQKCAVHIYSSAVWRCEVWGFSFSITLLCYCLFSWAPTCTEFLYSWTSFLLYL